MANSPVETVIRKAVPDDLFDLTVLIRSFCKANITVFGSFNHAKVSANLSGMIEADNTEIFVMERNGEVVGLLIGMVSEFMFSDNLVASEIAWFVEKEHRGIKSLKLLDAYEEWARSLGVDFITMSDLSELQGLEKLYERRGYRLSETSYIKEA